ncbi:hypothetical protein [Halioxenophilus sp. WMMB6]|uniref:Nmad3 family putative nucleotide modification protein n=1 Tax=Halioxenophilus sp. WMMB6 TaxID=3073815 RepID=UPI00295F28CD|nr:hypothetical protein [Halioxenophilus sp. WMMB6]
MKVIFSRKGFDSSAGGVPSPIFPDGTLLSLPIPDSASVIRYQDLQWPQAPPSKLLRALTKGHISARQGAHLDPDLSHQTLKRSTGWRPVLGQHGAAQAHLRNQGVGRGDLFLFFGLFRAVKKSAGRYQWDTASPAHHRLWGWLQVGEILKPEASPCAIPAWLRYHPHCQSRSLLNNTLYLAADRLQLSKKEGGIPAAGLFPSAMEELQLTAPNAPSPSHWQLLRWLLPGKSRTPLSYHHRADRWQQEQSHCLLKAAARGQEFVLQANEYPEAESWLEQLFARCTDGN